MKKLFAALVLLPFVAFAQVPPAGGFSKTWAVYHQPAAATQATISKAAATGKRHVATSITVCVSAVAAQGTLIFNLRDGATGAGTIVWTARLMGPAASGQCVSSGPLAITGTSNTAMTLESAAAPAATNFATVSLAGYTVNG
jgi:hypothetical protein